MNFIFWSLDCPPICKSMGKGHCEVGQALRCQLLPQLGCVCSRSKPGASTPLSSARRCLQLLHTWQDAPVVLYRRPMRSLYHVGWEPGNFAGTCGLRTGLVLMILLVHRFVAPERYGTFRKMLLQASWTTRHAARWQPFMGVAMVCSKSNEHIIYHIIYIYILIAWIYCFTAAEMMGEPIPMACFGTTFAMAFQKLKAFSTKSNLAKAQPL